MGGVLWSRTRGAGNFYGHLVRGCVARDGEDFMESWSTLVDSVASGTILAIDYPSLIDRRIISIPIAVMLYDALDIDLFVRLEPVFDVLEDA